MIEVDVHQQLRAYLRAVGGITWPHHLTLARLVARTLRLQRNALMQVSGQAAYDHRYSLSYLLPILLLPGPVVLVTSSQNQQRILRVQMPQLAEFLTLNKPVTTLANYPGPNFAGVLLLTHAEWLGGWLYKNAAWPPGIPTVVDGLGEIIPTCQTLRTTTLKPADWDDLILADPTQAKRIREIQVKLVYQGFQHPANPYGCHRLSGLELDYLRDLQAKLSPAEPLPRAWQSWFMALAEPTAHSLTVTPDYNHGQITLESHPLNIAPGLQSLWSAQPLVLLGPQVELDPDAPQWRKRLGLERLELTCLTFAPDRQQETLALSLPPRLALPNTPEFAPQLLQYLCQHLLTPPTAATTQEFAVVIVDDLPLQEQIAVHLAAQFGRQVQIETQIPEPQGILVCGWHFWVEQCRSLPTPAHLCLVTLPIPSREHPHVAAQIEACKQSQQDWFREYLWPACLHRLEQIIAPIRGQKTRLTILDTRVLYRTYGQEVLALIEPYEPIEPLRPGSWQVS